MNLRSGFPLASFAWFTVALAGLLFAWGPGHASGSDTIKRPDTDTFLAGVRAYEAGDYAGAVEAFSDLVARGYGSGPLYFNLGNSHLKEGHLGHAILWYERSLKLMPGNADLLYNLDYARALTRDEVDEPEVPLGRIIFFWKYRMSRPSVQVVSLLFWLAFWALLGVKRIHRGSLLRAGAVLTGFLGVLFVSTAFYNYYEERYSRDAVIVGEEVGVRAGTDEGATELFRLHAGTFVEARRSEAGHTLVSFTKDRVGWVPEHDVELIRGP